MAYMCVFNHRKECDGCQECEEQKQKFDPRWDDSYADFKRDCERDEAYISYLEREGY